MRGGRRLIEKLPNPRISMRCPRASASDIASRIVFTANSVSRWVSWLNRSASSATRSDRVMIECRGAAAAPGTRTARAGPGAEPAPPAPASGVVLLVVQLRAQQGTEAGGARGLALVAGRQALHRFLLVGAVLGLDR